MNITKNPWVLLITAALVMGMVGCSHFHHSKQCKVKHKVHVASEAQVSAAQAIQTASQKVQGTVVEAELEEEDNHKAIWEVEIVTADGKLMEVEIDAKSGDVLGVEEEKAD